MGKYERYNRRPDRERQEAMHPIWRGFGCLMIVIMPALSFALATILVPLAKRIGWMPASLTGLPRVPAFLREFPALIDFLMPVLSFQDLYATLLLTVVVLIVLSSLLSLIYAIAYSFIGPPRYSAIDAPPQHGRTKTYKR